MCNLCSNDQIIREMAEKGLVRQANDLRRLAAHFEKLSAREVDPHSDQAKAGGALARSIVRHLVEEYV